MADSDDRRPPAPESPAGPATATPPPAGDDRGQDGHDQGRGTRGAARDAEREQRRQLAEGTESPG